MKLDKEYVILLSIIAVLCTYLIMRSGDETHFELPQLTQVENKTVDRLVIAKKDGAIELRKNENKWVVGAKPYAANSAVVNNMIKTAVDLKITALVSEAENYEPYDLSEDKRVNVKAFSGEKEVRNFFIGSQPSTFRHTFVQIAGDHRVYHAAGGIGATFDKTVDELRDETVLSFDKGGITALTITKGDQTMTLIKKEVVEDKEAEKTESAEKKPENPKIKIQWVSSDGSIDKTDDAKWLISRCSKLQCNNFLEDDAKAQLKDQLWTLTFNDGEKVHTFTLYEKKDKKKASIEYPATSSGSPYAFIIHKSRVEAFEKHIHNILSPEAKEPEAKK